MNNSNFSSPLTPHNILPSRKLINFGSFQFERLADWIPHGVLALQTPRTPWMDKNKMRKTGVLLASSLTALKDQPLTPSVLQGGGGMGLINGKQIAGGVFSGFTNKDFEVEGELDFVGEGAGKSREGAVPPPTFLEVLEKLEPVSCYEKSDSQRRLLSRVMTR
jgi:hypothetical protein